MIKYFKRISTFLFAGFLLFGCNNNDTTSATETTTDTTTMMAAADNTNMMATPDTMNMMKDTMNTTMAKDKMDAMPAAGGMAKTNPAKKGKKGKVMISEPARSTAKPTMATDNSGVYSNAEVMPRFPGGYAGMQGYFNNNIAYPEAATNGGVDGVVNVSFTVDENGKIMSPMVMGDKLGYGLDEEALRVISKMPSWTPGTVNGKKVKTRFTLPVRFELE